MIVDDGRLYGVSVGDYNSGGGVNKRVCYTMSQSRLQSHSKVAWLSSSSPGRGSFSDFVEVAPHAAFFRVAFGAFQPSTGGPTRDELQRPALSCDTPLVPTSSHWDSAQNK